MMILKDRIAAQLPSWRERVSRLRKEFGSFKVGEVTVEQIYGGIRGVQISVSDISIVDPMEGVRLRDFTIPECLEKLPKAQGCEYPLMGGLYFLLMTGEMPTSEEAQEVENEWKVRANVPPHVFDIVRAMPVTSHPMTLFSQAVLGLQTNSVFAKVYSDRLPRGEYWDYYLEDSLNLTANLPAVAAFIYNYKYRNGEYTPPNPRLDWAANFAHMIGKGDDKEYQELCRLFFIIHSDHEGANVSAHACHLVASALSDIYLASSAGLNGLAGPLHGLANQECLRWLLETRTNFVGIPSKADLEKYLKDSLASGNTIPGYGHAVLRVTDPRFTVQLQFAEKYLPDDELLQLVKLVYETAPDVLKATGKVKNPYPNVDAINGTLQYHFGVRQFDFYTVLFGVSRLVGLTTHAIWSRALGKPIERPKSLTTKMLEDMVE
jgi:citrate synthase